MTIDLIKEFLFGVDGSGIYYAALPLLTIGMGLGQMAMGYDWGGKRKKALSNARAAYNRQKSIYRGLDTSIENPFEN